MIQQWSQQEMQGQQISLTVYIPLCLEPITTRDRVMQMEGRVGWSWFGSSINLVWVLSKQNNVSSSRNKCWIFSYQVVPSFFAVNFCRHILFLEGLAGKSSKSSEGSIFPHQAWYQMAPLSLHDAKNIHIFQKHCMITCRVGVITF